MGDLPTDESPNNKAPATHSSSGTTHVRSPTTPELIAQHVEGLFRLTIDAINARDFSIDSPAYNYISPDFQVSASHETPEFRFANDAEPSLANYLAGVAITIKEYPAWHLHIRDLSTEVSEQRRYATTYAYMEHSGRPSNVVISGMLVMRWSLIEGQWMCVASESLRGI